jgi:hypothetical protein
LRIEVTGIFLTNITGYYHSIQLFIRRKKEKWENGKNWKINRDINHMLVYIGTMGQAREIISWHILINPIKGKDHICWRISYLKNFSNPVPASQNNNVSLT